jgi:hypothetical protein
MSGLNDRVTVLNLRARHVYDAPADHRLGRSPVSTRE